MSASVTQQTTLAGFLADRAHCGLIRRGDRFTGISSDALARLAEVTP